MHLYEKITARQKFGGEYHHFAEKENLSKQPNTSKPQKGRFRTLALQTYQAACTKKRFSLLKSAKNVPNQQPIFR